MAVVSDITVTDSGLTPVDGTPASASHTYVPVEVGSNLVEYQDKSVPELIGRPTLTLGRRRVSQQNGNHKVTLRAKFPVLNQPVAGEPATLAYSITANVDVIIPGQASYDSRYDAAKLLATLVDDATFKNMIQEFDFPY